jgi:glycerol-3-phosphate dehydrogenase
VREARLHVMSRLAALRHTTFDVAIIGGGIIGAGIARDAAMRGLSVALFEKADYGGGTTAGSTRLIHGGLRYLEMLDFRLVRIDLREREILLRIAPHLVKPLGFVLPFYDRSLIYRTRMRAGLWLYDLLSYDKTLPNRRMLTADALHAQEPRLAADHLQGGASYFDAQASLPERLCIENIVAATAAGAQTFNYAEVVGALHDGDRVSGVQVRDLLDGDEAEAGAAGERGAAGVGGVAGASGARDVVDVRAKIVVNASGPWFDRVARKLTASSAAVPPARIRTTKGIHLAMPAMTQQAMVLFSPIDGRLIFVIPWLGYSWIGTTDTDFTGDPVDAHATAADVDYMLASVKPFLPDVEGAPIYFTNAGVRALVQDEGSESSVSRQHRIADNADAGAPGTVAVLGSKLTAYRGIAEEATDRVCKLLGVSQPCRTADEPLPGAHKTARGAASLPPGLRASGPEPWPDAASAAAGAGPSLGSDVATHLDSLYGVRAAEVLRIAQEEPALGRPLAPGYPDLAAQVRFAVREEQCARLVDFVFRRTRLGFTPDQGAGAAETVARLMAEELGWSAARIARELGRYAQAVAQTQQFRRPVS